MKLVFVNELGPDFRGNHIYEFIFSDVEDELWGEDWESVPALGKPLPPELEFIRKVGKLSKGGLVMNLGKDSDYFSMEDIIDGILSLSWEKIEDDDPLIRERLVFHFGEDIGSVEDKLYSRDLILEYNKEYENEH